MSEKRTTERGELYDKLTPQRKMLVDMILQNLDNGAGLWKQGWRTGGAPENAVTGKKYRGVNNMFLTFVALIPFIGFLIVLFWAMGICYKLAKSFFVVLKLYVFLLIPFVIFSV